MRIGKFIPDTTSHRAPVFAIVILLVCFGCATSKLTLIPLDKNDPIEGIVERSVGEANVTLNMPSGESIAGTMIWFRPGQSATVGVATVDGKTATAMGGNTGGSAMYVGTLIGNKGTKLKIDLLCNSFTIKCTGTAIANDGKTYNVILK